MITPGRSYERRWWTLAVLSLSLLIVNLDNTILNVALPTLARALSATGSELQWLVDAYVLVFAGLLLTAGALGDRFGRKWALFVGYTIGDCNLGGNGGRRHRRRAGSWRLAVAALHLRCDFPDQPAHHRRGGCGGRRVDPGIARSDRGAPGSGRRALVDSRPGDCARLLLAVRQPLLPDAVSPVRPELRPSAPVSELP